MANKLQNIISDDLIAELSKKLGRLQNGGMPDFLIPKNFNTRAVNDNVGNGVNMVDPKAIQNINNQAQIAGYANAIKRNIANQPVLSKTTANTAQEEAARLDRLKRYAESQGNTVDAQGNTITSPLNTLADNKTFKNASENVILPMMDMAMIADGAGAVGKGIAKAFVRSVVPEEVIAPIVGSIPNKTYGTADLVRLLNETPTTLGDKIYDTEAFAKNQQWLKKFIDGVDAKYKVVNLPPFNGIIPKTVEDINPYNLEGILGPKISKNGALNEGVHLLNGFQGNLLKFEKPNAVAATMGWIDYPKFDFPAATSKLRGNPNIHVPVTQFSIPEGSVRASVLTKGEFSHLQDVPTNIWDNIPQSHYDELLGNLQSIVRENNMAIDFGGDNIGYHPDTGFHFFDLSPNIEHVQSSNAGSWKRNTLQGIYNGSPSLDNYKVYDAIRLKLRDGYYRSHISDPLEPMLQNKDWQKMIQGNIEEALNKLGKFKIGGQNG